MSELDDLPSRLAALSNDVHDLLKALGGAENQGAFALAHDLLQQATSPIRHAYQASCMGASTIVMRGDGKARLEQVRKILTDAVTCEDAAGFVYDLIEQAKAAGYTKDGQTLTVTGEL